MGYRDWLQLGAVGFVLKGFANRGDMSQQYAGRGVVYKGRGGEWPFSLRFYSLSVGRFICILFVSGASQGHTSQFCRGVIMHAN